MNLHNKIDKPLFAYDLETTGADSNKDEIVQFFGIIILPQKGELNRIEFKCKPSIPIEEGATEVHGISNEDVRQAKTFQHYAKDIYNLISGYDDFYVSGYNISGFDLPILDRQMSECGYPDLFDNCHILDAFSIFKMQFPKDLSAAYRCYTNKELSGAHDASVDVLASLEVLEAQINKEDRGLIDISKDTSIPPEKRVGFSNHIVIEDDGEAYFGFGKHQDEKIINHKGYLNWMVNKGDFPRKTVQFIRGVLDGKT